eukprot:3264439-Amphidinium_carterae.1
MSAQVFGHVSAKFVQGLPLSTSSKLATYVLQLTVAGSDTGLPSQRMNTTAAHGGAAVQHP